MRAIPFTTLEKKIFKATLYVLTYKNIADDKPLEYYADEIMLKSLEYCCHYFLKIKGLKKSEKKTLLTLEENITDNLDLNTIEKNLTSNLNAIKPNWGEFFGTNRGHIYNTLSSLLSWPGFTYQVRLYYSEQRQKKHGIELKSLTHSITQQSDNLAYANNLIIQHEKNAESLTKRTATQFITIQKLRMENSELKTSLEEILKKPKQKNTPQIKRSTLKS